MACLLSLAACSPNQNSFTSNIYHNLTAHFNGYYYANEGVRNVEATILKSLDDDHNLLLHLYPKLDTNLAKSYSKETEEIIKMASISIQRHPNSRWVYKNYIMVGLARLYDCHFQDAIQTFKYVNTKCNNPDIRHEALIHLIRTFTEQGEYQKAEETIDFLSREKLSKENQKYFYLNVAYLAQVRENYDQMVQNLIKADRLLKHNDRPGRIYFIIGQVYQKLGFGSEAFNYYRKCISTNPEYEIDFYARLNMAQVTGINDKSNSKEIRRQLLRMLNDDKNIDFKDKIYFEIGEFELRQGNLSQALENYRLCLRAGSSERIRGNGYLRLGQIYYDSVQKFSLAKDYYDSAVNTLPDDTENLDVIKRRQGILTDFVLYTETIHLQDSLLRLADMDTAVLRKVMDSTKKAADLAASAKKPAKKKGSGGPAVRPAGTFYGEESTTTSDWYFGNLSAVSIGQTEFQRIWGTIRLEDNWRRSVKTSTIDEGAVAAAAGPAAGKTTDSGATKEISVSADPFMELYNQLPLTQEKKDSAYARIEKSLLKLGDLYYFKLLEKENAVKEYKTLVARFPVSKYRPEVLYKLYLAGQDLKLKDHQAYKSELIENFPETSFAKLLINPNYLAETGATIDRQKLLYKEAFNYFNSNDFVSAERTLDDAISLGQTNFSSRAELLKILITGKTEEPTIYQYQLGEFIKKYTDDPIKSYAEILLEASKSVVAETERIKGIRFTRNTGAPHQVVIIHNRENNLSSTLTGMMENYNTLHFRDQKLITSNLVLDENLTMTIILDFPKLQDAVSYIQEVNGALASGTMVNYKFNIFAITQENFGTLYKTKALPEYLSFYDRNY
ncbi:MAG: hypothetical protein ACO3FI_00330 [Cyclobacteriaceae bacterium]